MKTQIDNAVVWIGHDAPTPMLTEICEHSLLENSTMPTEVRVLDQEELRSMSLYQRSRDSHSTTQHTFTRFLVPRLMNYQGWAVYCDSDFVWIADIAELLALADDRYAVMVVKHDYRSTSRVKRNGQPQANYPRKNWSSMILWNCAHPKNRALDPMTVATWSRERLQQFQWLDNKDIGTLAPRWNWLVNWYDEKYDGQPGALHFTEGGPWLDNYQRCDYARLWHEYADLVRESNAPDVGRELTQLDMPDKYRRFFQDIVEYVQNPRGIYGGTPQRDDLVAWIDTIRHNQLIGISEDEDLTKKMKSKGNRWDGIVQAFVQGTAGQMSPWSLAQHTPGPIALRSIAKRKIMKQCLEAGRDFYYIDTGYFGNDKRKEYHRITKNAMQWLGDIEDRPADRFERTGVQIKDMTPGSKILICPPSAKALAYWDLEEATWLQETIAEIKKHTDREIVVRLKQPRQVRATTDTMEHALSQDIHCLVTFNSIAAIEALYLGKPVFTLGPNAAHHLSNTDLADIDSPRVPTMDEVRALMHCLAYHQFTVKEMMNGYAWEVLNQS